MRLNNDGLSVRVTFDGQYIWPEQHYYLVKQGGVM